MKRILTFAILVSLWGCSAPVRPEPTPAARPVDLDAGSADLDVGADVEPYASCGEYFVIEADGAVTKIAWGPCHT